MDYISKSYIFIPFLSHNELSEISGALDISGKWEYVNSSDTQLSAHNARYMMKYVAGRINNKADSNSICIQRKLNIEKATFASSLFDTAYTILNPGNVESDSEMTRKTIDFHFSNAFLFCFSTGINLLCLEIQYSETDYNKISDCLFNLKNARVKRIIPSEIINSINTDNCKESFLEYELSLCEISQKILSDISVFNGNSFMEHSAHKDFQRVNILTYYETAEISKPDLELALFKMSHCYNSRFKYSSETDDTFSHYNNNSICQWGITSGSSVCIAFPTEDAHDFVANVFRNDFGEGYLLSYVLLLNQKYTLYSFLIETGDKLNGEENDYKKAYDFRNKFYLFKINYNFRTISELPQYQNVYDMTYNAFNIDKLISDVKEPLDALESILESEHEKKEKKRKEDEETARKEFERKEEEYDRKTQHALTVLSTLAIFSALADSWAFLTIIKPIILRTDSFVGNIGQLVLAGLIIVIYLYFIVKLFFNGRRKNKNKNNKK